MMAEVRLDEGRATTSGAAGGQPIAQVAEDTVAVEFVAMEA
jgi:hypothetical protein